MVTVPSRPAAAAARSPRADSMTSAGLWEAEVSLDLVN